MTNQHKNDTEPTEKSELTALLSELSQNQLRFVIAMKDYGSKKEAAIAIGLTPDTVYRWPPEVDLAIDLLKRDAVLSAKALLTRDLLKAVAVKVAGLDSEDEKIAQAAASEIIDRLLGKSTQRNEVSGTDGGPIEIAFRWVEVDGGGD